MNKTLENKYICKYCRKQCKNKNSYAQHIIRCKFNKNRINVYQKGFNKLGRIAWNKGLTKDTDSRIANSRITFYYNKSLGLHNNYIGRQNWTNESKQKLRNAAIKRGLGGVRQTKKILYNGIKLGSTYEVELAKDLDANNIKWVCEQNNIKVFILNKNQLTWKYIKENLLV